MKYKKLEVGFLGTNCYIIFSEIENKCMLIDPAFDSGYIEKNIDGCTVDKIFLTHGHIDHIYQSGYFRQKYSAGIYIGEGDVKYLNTKTLHSPNGICSEFENQDYKYDVALTDNDKLEFCEYTFDVISTPGHTPGCMCLFGSGHLFCGDLLFYRSVGRTDFPMGSLNDMINSIKNIMTLPDDTIVHPGHGAETTIGDERLNNMYVKYYI